MATTDGPEWEWCEEHETHYDDHLCPDCQKERRDESGREAESEADDGAESGADDGAESGADDGGRAVVDSDTLDRVPDFLADRDRWTLFDDDKERNRQPLKPTRGGGLRGVSWTDDDELLSFDDARELVDEKESYGVMYILADDSDLTVFDIDGGIYYDDDGRPRLKEWLRKLASFLGNTYIEVSPSGTGIHVYFLGDLPEEWNNNDVSYGEHEGVEAFDGSRPMTVTGVPPRGLERKQGDTIAPIDDGGLGFLTSAWENWAEDGKTAPWNRETDAQTPGESRSNPVPAGEFDRSGRGLTEAQGREALGEIPPNCGYEKWRNIGYATVDEFGEALGGKLFREWSKQSGKKWDDDAPRLADDIIHGDGEGVTGGTLVYHATRAGWTPPWESSDHDDDSAEGDDAAAEGDDHAARVVKTWKEIRENHYLDDDTSRKTARARVVEKLLSDHDYATPRDTGTIWVYHPAEGIYDRAGETHIRETLERNLGALKDVNETRQIIEKVKDRTWIDREAFDRAESNPRLLCVENGVLNLVTRKLHDHSAEYMFKTRAPVEYDPEAGGEEIRSFAHEVTGREGDAKALMEVAGLSLWSDHSLYPAFVVLIGDGGNGKGVFGDALTALLGEENVSGVDLHDLSSNRFAVAPLENKYANLGEDIPGAKVSDLSTLKAITGGDRMYVERKHEDGYEAEIRATPIFSVNEPPTFGERSRALKRRLVPIEFPYDFADDPGDGEKKKDRNRADKLTTDEALSGFLNEALDGLDRLRENGDFSLPEDKDERLERYEKKADPIAAFGDECLESVNEGYVTKEAVYKAYVEFCEEKEIEAKRKATFYRELRRATPLNLQDPYVRLGDDEDKDRVRALRGVFLTPKGRELCPDLSTTVAVNEKRSVNPWSDSPGAGLDKENPENRDPRLRVLEKEIQEVAAIGDGREIDELAELVARNVEYDKAEVKERIKAMENKRKLTKSTAGYEAPERAEVGDFMG
jgi:P4 family phage/plasmid primase-like protien